LGQSDGYITIGENLSLIPRGTRVTVSLYNKSVYPAVLAVIGSHSITNDIILEQLRFHHPNIRIKQINTGSLGGLHAVASGFAHIAGIHLLDDKSGEYNLPYIFKFNYSDRVDVIKGFTRPQGFIVQKGNPKGINNIEDLIKEDVQLINRNPGSGTRILLDQLLNQQGITPQGALENVKGYQIEVNTHSAVASAIKHGRADVGLGIQTIAENNDLDFIKIRDEQYDFAIQKTFLDHEVFQIWRSVLTSRDLTRTVHEKMPWIVLPSNIGDPL
jgi:putative molybdopterin biosynthesis protein